MRIATRFMGVVFLGMLLLLTLDAYLSVRRDISLFENTMRRNGLLFGRTVREAVQDAWRRDGMQAALAFVRRVGRQPDHMRIRWVRLDAPPGDPQAPRVPPQKRISATKGQPFSVRWENGGKSGLLVTYVPLAVPGAPSCALEVSQSLSGLYAYIRTRVLRSVFLVLLLAAFSGVMLWVFGRRVLGRPLDALVAKTRRIGAGDFSGPLHFHGHNELATLAEATNEMCRQLARTRDELRGETEARIQAIEQLRHSDRLATLGRLSSGIAHELGTPLNVVSGRARMIASGTLSTEEMQESARIIDDQARRMTALIRQLLDFARRRPPNKTCVDLKRLAEQVLQVLDTEATRKKVRLVFQPARDNPKVRVDAFQIQQVLTNLVVNAIQASSEGGAVDVRVKPQTPPSKGGPSEVRRYMTLQVEDQGGGISPEDLKNIFEPFFTTKKAGHGTGLGLSIAQGIVEEHGGWIGVDSQPGQGTCFTVWLPVEETPCTEAS